MCGLGGGGIEVWVAGSGMHRHVDICVVDPAEGVVQDQGHDQDQDLFKDQITTRIAIGSVGWCVCGLGAGVL